LTTPLSASLSIVVVNDLRRGWRGRQSGEVVVVVVVVCDGMVLSGFEFSGIVAIVLGRPVKGGPARCAECSGPAHTSYMICILMIS